MGTGTSPFSTVLHDALDRRGLTKVSLRARTLEKAPSFYFSFTGDETMAEEFKVENGWVIDTHNNRANIQTWGSKEKAIESLKSCSGCSDCSRCSDCSGCVGCSDCVGCSRCSGCHECSNCTSCHSCLICSDCHSCHSCSRCHGCCDCLICSRCHGCFGNKASPTVPEINDIHTAVYEAASQPNALDMSDWHSCETTHCRAGWVVHLAGKAGYKLEKETSPVFAAMQIYKASGYEISPCRFFGNNEESLADMKLLTEGENK